MPISVSLRDSLSTFDNESLFISTAFCLTVLPLLGDDSSLGGLFFGDWSSSTSNSLCLDFFSFFYFFSYSSWMLSTAFIFSNFFLFLCSLSTVLSPLSLDLPVSWLSWFWIILMLSDFFDYSEFLLGLSLAEFNLFLVDLLFFSFFSSLCFSFFSFFSFLGFFSFFSPSTSFFIFLLLSNSLSLDFSYFLRFSLSLSESFFSFFAFFSFFSFMSYSSSFKSYSLSNFLCNWLLDSCYCSSNYLSKSAFMFGISIIFLFFCGDSPKFSFFSS